MKDYKVFTINPGSTSTKVALFKGTKCLFSQNVSHRAEELAAFASMAEQYPYREKTILSLLDENQIDISDCDAFVGRGGGLLPMVGGTYAINEILLDHAANSANGVIHPALLGPLLADSFAKKAGAKAFVVNAPDTDEFQDVARMTGIEGVYRKSHLHVLNLKETAIRHSKENGKRYEDCNYVVCHIGGGVSVSAHRKGRIIDGNDISGGSGPMAPTRCGDVSVVGLIECLNAGDSVKEIHQYALKTGGFVSWLGTSDALEVSKRIEAGDKKAKMVWDTFIYQIEKYIGAMACALAGKVDGILLGGGIVHSKELVARITEDCGWIAPVYAYPGEFEMEAMAAGAIRVLSGEEECKEYTGKPSWDGFDFS